jgi:hypothetical protein
MRYHVRNAAVTGVLLLRNQQILKSLDILVTEHGQEKSSTKQSRPHSPVKMLSNLFGSSHSRDSSHPSLRLKKTNSVLSDIPKMMPPQSKPPSRDGKPSSRPGSQDSKPPSRDGFSSQGTPRTPLENVLGKSTLNVNGNGSASEEVMKIEETLASFILALHARKGNVLGKVLQARVYADEAATNELYNTLLEDPQHVQTAAVAPVDVLFSAFEKFLKVAWKDKVGPVISLDTLTAIQSKSDSVSQPEFEEFFRTKFAELTLPNQRALRATIQLLAELMEGTSSDSDRGIMTSSFAEVLVPEGNPHGFISLIDRLVEDMYSLFGRPGSSGAPTPMTGSINSDMRSIMSGSITSNTSSIRKRFGLGGLSRENSKLESESKLGSVWRTLSKNSKPVAPLPDKPGLGRSLSTDVDGRISPKRPSSRERPALHGAFTFEGGDSPAVGRNWFGGAGLDTIGEGVPSATPKKKRRSSLSDLHALRGETPPQWGSRPTTPRSRMESLRGTFRQSSASPRSPSPTKQPNPGSRPHTPSRLGSPLPSKDENSPASALPRPRPSVQASSPTKGEQVTISSYAAGSHRRSQTPSSIPTLKALSTAPAGSSALTERPAAGNMTKLPTSVSDLGSDKTGSINAGSSSPTKRLRMQSPQKLRERLNNENAAISSTESGLTAELSKIGDELSALNLSPTKASRQGGASTVALAARVKDLESKVHTQLGEISQRNTQLAKDVSGNMAASEARAKKLEELYRDADAENEALYGKFNEELARAVRAVKAGDGVEEMKKRLREALEEQGALRRELWKLRKEVAGYKASG